jgi:hypothetical protein
VKGTSIKEGRNREERGIARSAKTSTDEFMKDRLFLFIPLLLGLLTAILVAPTVVFVENPLIPV